MSRDHLNRSTTKVGAFNALPDHLLMHIGETILDLCGVECFIQFAETSKHIHRILMDKDFVSSILGSKNQLLSNLLKAENDNYFKHVLPSKTISITNERIASVLRSEYDRIFKFLQRRKYYSCSYQPETVLSTLDAENDSTASRILNRIPSVTTVGNLEELALCQTVIEAKNTVGWTIYPDLRPLVGRVPDFQPPANHFDRERYERQLTFIAATLVKHPSASVIVDLHGDAGFYMSKVELKFKYDLLKVFAQMVEFRDIWALQVRVHLRFRGLSSRSDLQERFGNHPYFFEIGFRMGGIEVPPLRSAKGQKSPSFEPLSYDIGGLLKDVKDMYQGGVTLPPGWKEALLMFESQLRLAKESQLPQLFRDWLSNPLVEYNDKEILHDTGDFSELWNTEVGRAIREGLSVYFWSPVQWQHSKPMRIVSYV